MLVCKKIKVFIPSLSPRFLTAYFHDKPKEEIKLFPSYCERSHNTRKDHDCNSESKHNII